MRISFFCFLTGLFAIGQLAAASPTGGYGGLSPVQAPLTPGQQKPSTPPPKTPPGGKPPVPGHPGATGAGGPFRAIHTSPGTVTIQHGEWAGSENLFNLSPTLGVIVEVVSPGGKVLNELAINKKVEEDLKAAKITVHGMPNDRSPLPFLHILIMMEKIDKGYAVYASLRLFEEVQLKRVFLPPDIVWQAITWERQELISTPPELLQDQVMGLINSFLKEFTDKFKSYPPTGK